VALTCAEYSQTTGYSEVSALRDRIAQRRRHAIASVPTGSLCEDCVATHVASSATRLQPAYRMTFCTGLVFEAYERVHRFRARSTLPTVVVIASAPVQLRVVSAA